VNPQSRRRGQSPGGQGHGTVRPGSPESPPEALFTEMLRAARELLAVRSPLDAELLVSEMLGTWWAPRARRVGLRGPAGIEELVGEGLVEYAAQQATPAAPEEPQVSTLPSGSVIVTMVLLKLLWMYATPRGTFLRSRRRTR